MMRKIFLLLTVICLVLAITPNVGLAQCDEHDFQPDNRTTYQYVIVEMNGTGHTYRVFLYQTCSLCGCQMTGYHPDFPPIFEPHDYEIFDYGHQTGTVHRYLYQCKECGYSVLHNVYCEGPCPSTPINRKTLNPVYE